MDKEDTPNQLLAKQKSIFNQFTPRLKELAVMLTKGMSNKEIAVETTLTIGTIKNYVGVILKAYNVPSRLKAAIIIAGLGVHSPLESKPIKRGT